MLRQIYNKIEKISGHPMPLPPFLQIPWLTEYLINGPNLSQQQKKDLQEQLVISLQMNLKGSNFNENLLYIHICLAYNFFDSNPSLLSNQIFRSKFEQAYIRLIFEKYPDEHGPIDPQLQDNLDNVDGLFLQQLQETLNTFSSQIPQIDVGLYSALQAIFAEEQMSIETFNKIHEFMDFFLLIAETYQYSPSDVVHACILLFANSDQKALNYLNALDPNTLQTALVLKEIYRNAVQLHSQPAEGQEP